MSTPTTNPVPSKSPADLLFNAEKFDEAINSSLLQYTDRLGVVRLTMAGAVARISAVNSRGAWATATAYAALDLVVVSGTWYIALDAHTSGATFAGDAGAHWRVYQTDGLVVSSQPANAWRDFVVPGGGSYYDNGLTLENRSQDGTGKRGNAAIRFRQASPDGGVTLKPERAAIGYSAPGSDNPKFLPNLLYAEVGNLTAGDTEDSDFAVVVTHVNGAVNFSNTQYLAIWVDSSNGEITIKNGPSGDRKTYLQGNLEVGLVNAPRQVQLWMKSTAARWRERDGDDMSAWTTNVDTGTTKDNTGKSAWRQQMGHGTGEDRWRLSRMPSGSSTWDDLVTVDNEGCLFSMAKGTAPALSLAHQIAFQYVDNTHLKLLMRGADGTTRSITFTIS